LRGEGAWRIPGWSVLEADLDRTVRQLGHVESELRRASTDLAHYASRHQAHEHHGALWQAKEFGAGALDSFARMAVSALKSTPGYVVVNPVGYFHDSMATVQGVQYGIAHPREFGKALLNWDMWSKDPARAAGQLLPSVIAAVATRGSSKVNEAIDAEEVLQAEAMAAESLRALEESTPHAHFFVRHGAHVTLQQLLDRAKDGLTPDGVKLWPVNSSRFLSHRDQLAAVERAHELYRQQPGNRIPFDMDHSIGEGYLEGGSDLIPTRSVLARFRGGRLVTIYPELEP
jgi:hypothetical protein